jgi:ankyrin repeat protein
MRYNGAMNKELHPPAPLPSPEPGPEDLFSLRLIIAAQDGDMDTARQCLLKEANPRWTIGGSNSDKTTALMMAVQSSKPEMARLLAPLSDIDAVDKHGNTALMLSILRDAPECFHFLLPLSNPRIADLEATTPLMAAIKRGRDELALILLPLSDIDAATEHDGRTALFRCASRADINPDVVKALLLAGADATILDRFGASALHYAARFKNMAFLQAAMGLCDPLTRDIKGQTAFDVATKAHPSCSCAEFLSFWELSAREKNLFAALAPNPLSPKRAFSL